MLRPLGSRDPRTNAINASSVAAITKRGSRMPYWSTPAAYAARAKIGIAPKPAADAATSTAPTRRRRPAKWSGKAAPLSASMFNPTRDDVRRFFCETWSKYLAGQVLLPIEATALRWIEMHPEYHALLEDTERAVGEDF